MARMGGSKQPERTGKLIVVTFEHDTARPVDGVASPEIHTHAIAANMTETADGKVRSLQTEEMYNAQRFMTNVYRSELAMKVQEIGFEVERGKHGEPELKGYSRAFIDDISLRRKQINERAQETGFDGARAKNLYALETRKGKREIQEEKTDTSIRQAAQKHGIDFANLERQALERGPGVALEQHRQQAAKEALDYSRDHNSERSATFRQDQLVGDALDRGMGSVTRDDVVRELQQRTDSGEFLQRREARTSPVLSTDRQVSTERETIAIMQRGQGRMEGIAPDPAQAIRQVSEAKELQGAPVKLNEAQQRVFDQVITSRDQVQGIQGHAGTGKTFTLRSIRITAEQNGYEVKGFGTTGRNTRQLADSGIRVETLASHLQKGDKAHEGTGKVLYVVDESSLASSRDMHAFVSRLRPDERAVLVGDTGQHQSVDAGKAFEQLQEAGMQTGRLDQVVRQKQEQLREIVTDLANGRTHEAFVKLKDGGFIHEIKDNNERLQALTRQTLKYSEEARAEHPGDTERAKTILVTPQNDRKRELNQEVREQMQARGELAKDQHTVKVLEPRQDTTRTQLKWAAKYEVGNVLKYYKDSPSAKIAKDDYARVTGRNVERNTITVEFLNGRKAGQRLEYDPSRRSGCAVYRESERQLAAGDSVQFTAKWADQKINNREMATVQAVDKEGNLQLRTESGREVRFNASEFRHLEHGYCSTSHVAQGQTAGFSGGDFPTEGKNPDLINPRSLYVTVSRCQHDCGIYTDDANRLEQLVSREVTNETAIDAEKYRSPRRMQETEVAVPQQERMRQELEVPNGHQREQPLSVAEMMKRELEPAGSPVERTTEQGSRGPTLEQADREAREARQSLFRTLGRERAQEEEKQGLDARAQEPAQERAPELEQGRTSSHGQEPAGGQRVDGAERRIGGTDQQQAEHTQAQQPRPVQPAGPARAMEQENDRTQQQGMEHSL